jgi:uncharacterized protein (TIGR00661 family)
MKAKRVLVAPLDWGLGHATRCIPIIEELQKRNCEVFIASSGSALALLRKEFPDATFFALPSYRIKYPRKGSFVFSIGLQIPKIWRAIAREHKRIQKLVHEHDIDLIFSDNRYGCWVTGIQSVFISHQLNIQLMSGWKIFKPIINLLHNNAVRKFNRCWIPDDPKLKLTGNLSKPGNLSVTSVGILSRFKKRESTIKYDLAIVLSGPEPQRSLFEEIIFKQITNQNLTMAVVRGVIEAEGNFKQENNVTIFNFLSSAKLEEIINQSKLIIARSGYSTIMDLARLGKRAIFIPTPGQTEQEYLGRKLMKDKIALCVKQHEFDLSTALKKTDDFMGFSNIEPENELLAKALDEVLK